MNLLAYFDANNQLAAFREGPWKLHIRNAGPKSL